MRLTITLKGQKRITAEQRSKIARANGARGGRGNFVWTDRRQRRAQELKDDGFAYSEIASRMRCEVGSVAGMFYREKMRRR